MRTKVFSLLTVLLCYFAQSQHSFLKIPKLEEQDIKNLTPKDGSEIPAEILHRSVNYDIDMNGNLTKKFVERVKIYNKDQAENFFNKEIQYYESSTLKQSLTNLKASTYNFENGKIDVQKVRKDSKFKSKEDNTVTIAKFTFPNVKNGSVLEYEYTIFSPSDFLRIIPEFIIEDEVPAKYVEYTFDFPNTLGYNVNYNGSLLPKHQESAIKTVYGADYKVTRFGFENVPAFKKEKFVLNSNNYKTSIRMELNSTNFGSFKSYSTTWDDIRKSLLEDENFGRQMNRMNLVKNFLPTEIRANISVHDKLSDILNFVQKEYTWNGNTGIFTDKGVRNLLSTKTGNVAEINLLLIMLLRDVGIEADPVILTTINKGVLKHYSPSITIPNYVVVLAEVNGKNYLLDAASKYTKVNMIAPMALNYNGIRMGKEAQVIDIAYNDISQTFLTVESKLNPDFSFEGTFSDKDTKLYSVIVNDIYNRNKEEFIKGYKDKYKFTLSDIKPTTVNDDFETTMNFHSDTFVDKIGNKIAFNPMLFLYTHDHDFNQKETRVSPIEFLSGNEKVKKITITLPEGYVFESIPSSKKFRTDDDSIKYHYIATKEASNKLTIESSILINGSFFPKEFFPAFKQIFDNITKLEGQVATVVKN